MTERDLGPLDDDLQALLRAEADRPELDDSVRDRVRERVLRTIAFTGGDPGGDGGAGSSGSSGGAVAAGGSGSGVSAGAATAATTGLGTALSSPFVIGVLSFVVGGFAGAAVHSTLRAPPEPEVRIVTVPAVPQHRDDEPPTESPEVVGEIETIEEVAEAEAPAPALPTTPRARPSVPSSGSDSASPTEDPLVVDTAAAGTVEGERDEDLVAENALIDRATTALARGRPAQALAALREHAARFPGGQQVQEREALWIQALVRAGRHDDARARGERFRARWPRSMLRRAVDATLESIP